MKYEVGKIVETKYGLGIIVGVSKTTPSIYVKVPGKDNNSIYILSKSQVKEARIRQK